MPISSYEGIGKQYYEHRRQIMLDCQEGLTKTYNRFHDFAETAADIARLRELHVEMDNANAAPLAPFHRKRKPMDDPYLDIIDEYWDKIVMMYDLFADKRPVMLFELPSLKIYAYPYREFKADLNQRSQAILTHQYREAQANGQMVLFVRDNDKQKFKSYTLNLEQT